MEDIKTQRQLEISAGENAATASPLYFVYQRGYTVVEPDTAYDQSTTRFGYMPELVRFDEDGNQKAAEKDPSTWDEQKGKWRPVVKKVYHDKFVTVCFTRLAAENFIKAEKHNLKKPKIFVEYCERRNIEMQSVLAFLGDS